MGKSGVSLGADIYELWNAGKVLLPTVADQFLAANVATPVGVGWVCDRPGPIGIGSRGPAAQIDEVLGVLLRAETTQEKNLRAVGEALVDVANDYARTDEAAAAEFHRKQVEAGQVPS